MAIVMGLDQHRAQITADWLDTETGEISRARVTPAHRDGVRRFLGRFAGQQLEVALEATTGWRFVVEELQAVGAEVHLAEPAETSSRRGSKKRAKTDRADARHLRELLMVGRLPESWIALGAPARSSRPGAVASHARRPARRVAAAHPGGALSPRRRAATRSAERRQAPVAGGARAAGGGARADHGRADGHRRARRPVGALTRELRAYARRQPGCRALMRHYGIGALTAVTILAELGDARRFSSSRHAVRYAGLDITVHQSDQRRAPGHLSRQGPPALRWALYEAAQLARRPGSPDHAYYEPGRRAPRRQSRLPGRRSQAAQAQLPHPARTRRRGAWRPPPDCSRCARSPHRHRCPAAGSPHAPAATVTTWPAQKDRAAAPRQPAGTPHQPSRHRPAARPDRGPR